MKIGRRAGIVATCTRQPTEEEGVPRLLRQDMPQHRFYATGVSYVFEMATSGLSWLRG